jgi:hypothetical protein
MASDLGLSEEQSQAPIDEKVAGARSATDSLIEALQQYNKEREAELQISEASMAAIREHHIDASMLADMDLSDWLLLKCTVGEKKLLQQYVEWEKEEAMLRNKELYHILPGNPKYNVLMHVAAIITLSPGVIVGLLKDIDDLDDPPSHYFDVLIPGVLLFVVILAFSFNRRQSMGWDMIEEASPGIDMRESTRATLTNNAIVGALLLTVAVAMVQSDPPLDASRLLSQWYQVLNCTAMLHCFIATTRSVMLLVYIEPLDSDASFMFVCRHLVSGFSFTLSCPNPCIFLLT